MSLRVLAALAVIVIPIELFAQCQPGIRCQRAAPQAPAVVPFKPKIAQPSIGQQAPPQSKFKQRPPQNVGALPKINTPQPPARRPGGAPTVPAAARQPGASGTVMNKYICQTPETYCRLNTLETVEAGAACHCRGVQGKIK